tara:strand:- start:1030 stop:2124 length:1095 start_codon:yes stop_codon:yes gene_type:complete
MPTSVDHSKSIPSAWKGIEGLLRATLSPVNSIGEQAIADHSFSKTPFGTSITVSESQGVMYGVSLLQVGEAKGHGLFIDKKSLETALESLKGKTLAAHITHNGAHQEDRMLLQIGFFESFYIEDDKLKAKEFKALQSFKEDEPERYNRLFDLASEMPDAFGLSLVFEADLVYVLEDNTEELIVDSNGEKAIREMPSVRFINITSADFVDAPAANRDGLFSETNKKELIMEDATLEKEEVKELAEEETSVNVAIAEDEQMPSEEEEENASEEEEEEETDLSTQVKELTDRVGELEKALSASQKENDIMSEALSGSDPIHQTLSAKKIETSVVRDFLDTDGQSSVTYFQANKDSILTQYNTLRGDK